MPDLSSFHPEFEPGGLVESEMDADPVRQFGRWFDEAVARRPGDWLEPNAVTLATAGRGGQVSCRTVLLKHFDEAGFTFFTNYASSKARQIVENPRVSLLFFWAYMSRQIRIEGTATRTTRDVSEHYFHSRPRASQIAAASSRQSETVASRAELERRFADLERQFSGQPVPLPDDWGGFTVQPIRYEFWHGRPNRLHDRIRYERTAQSAWRMDRLQP
jgi:pyridoxamine 5'-phosphate oxidase